MIPPASKSLIDLFQNNHDIIHMQFENVTQAESLLQLPFRGNCMNWVIGHILDVREACLGLLELPGVMTEAEKATYGYGSDPIVDPTRASNLDSLLSRLDESLRTLVARLEGLSQADLDRPVEIWRGPMPLAEALFFMLWHEAYHSGQLEQLRQLTGKNDHII